EDNPTLFDADENRYAASLAYHERELEEEVALIDNTRRQLARILRTVPDSALSRTCTYRLGDRAEPRTLEHFLNKAVRHFAHHIPFILDKRRALKEQENFSGRLLKPATQPAPWAGSNILYADTPDYLGQVRELFQEYASFLKANEHGEDYCRGLD